MFKRVLTDENLTQIIAMLSFGISFSIFLFFSIKAFFLNKNEAKRVAELPLEKEEK